MSLYRFLRDHSIGQNYYQAGSTASTADVGGTLPAGWVPSGQVEPLDAAAIQDFFDAGPQQLGGPIRVTAPAVYWQPYPAGGGTRPMILTGAGAALGFRNWVTTRGAAP